jgi:hypothetical protein
VQQRTGFTGSESDPPVSTRWERSVSSRVIRGAIDRFPQFCGGKISICRPKATSRTRKTHIALSLPGPTHTVTCYTRARCCFVFRPLPTPTTPAAPATTSMAQSHYMVDLPAAAIEHSRLPNLKPLQEPSEPSRDRARVPRSLAFAEGRQLRGAGRDGLHDSLRERRSREQQGPWAALHGAAAVPHDLDRLLVDDQPLLPPSDAQQQLGSVWDHLLATSPRPAKHRRLLLPEPQPGARQVLFALDSVVSEGRSRPRSRRGQRADDARRLANLQRMAKDVPPVAA